MKFYAALLSFVSSKQTKIVKKHFEGPVIELAEKLLVENGRYIPIKKRGFVGLYFGNYIFGSKGELLAGEMGKDSKIKIPKYENGKFRDEEDKAYPHIHFLWNRSQQLILLEVDTAVFRNYETVISSIENHLNNLLDPYEYTVYIKPLTDKTEFWRVVDSFDRLYEATFEMHMPNSLGRTHKDIKEMLNYYKNEYNATSFANTLSNDDGQLHISQNDSFVNKALEWITKGAGLWILQGIQKGKKNKVTINSKSSKYMKTLETSAEFQNYTHKEVISIFNDLKINQSLLVDTSDEESNK